LIVTTKMTSMEYLITMAAEASKVRNVLEIKRSERNLYSPVGPSHSTSTTAIAPKSNLAQEIAAARKRIEESLKGVSGGGGSAIAMTTVSNDFTLLTTRIEALESENKARKQEVNDLRSTVKLLEERLKSSQIKSPAKPPPDDEDEIDLFGSEDEDDASEAKQALLKAYEEKKKKKPGPIAKSSVVLDVKPWDDETDMKEMEKLVRSIVMDGLVWGASKLVPLAYGIQKLQIGCVVEDEKVSIDELQEKIQEFEEFVQSVDIAAFNKI